MVEWWQALLISVASSAGVGVVGLLTAFFVHRWTRDSTIEAESRQARRDERREDVKPIRQFLDIARRAGAFHRVKAVVSRNYAANVNDVQSRMTRDEYLERMLRGLEEEPEGPSRMGHAFHVAAATAPTEEMVEALVAVYEAVIRREDENSLVRLREAVQKALRLNANYISDDPAT